MCTLQSLCLHYNIYVYSTISMCTLQSLMYTTISMVLHHRSQTFVRCRCCCEFIEIVTLRCHSLWTRQWINGSFGKSFPWNKIDNTFVAMFLFGIFARSAVSVTRVGEISPLWQILQVFGNFSTVDFLFGKILNLLWQPCCNTGPFFNVVND